MPNIPAQIIARATGVTGNQIFPDTFDFKQITTEQTTADSRPVGDCEGTTYLTGQIFGGAKSGEDWTVIVVTDHDHGLLLPRSPNGGYHGWNQQHPRSPALPF